MSNISENEFNIEELDGEDAEYDVEALFKVKFDVQVRSFVGNTASRKLGHKTVMGSSVMNFKENLWTLVKPLIKREVTFDANEVPSFVDEDPTFDDLGKFVSINDKIKKKNIDPSQLNSRLLTGWHDKTPFLYIHEYSTNVYSLAVFNKVKRTLIEVGARDRGGAASNGRLNEIVQLLKEKHGRYYVAQEISWQQWAAHISTKDQYEQERLISKGPPARMIQLFGRVADNAGMVLGEMMQNLSVARSVLGSKSAELKDLRASFNAMKSIAQQQLEAAQAMNDLMNDFEIRLTAAENTTETSEHLIESMESAAFCNENPYASEYYREIEDAADIDHQ